MAAPNLTIRLKVLLAFGLLLLVAMALGIFAMNRLASVNAAAAELRSKWLPSTQIVARMSLTFEQYRIAEGRALVAASEHARRAVEDDLRVRSQEVQRQRAAYQPTITSDEERGIVREFDRHWDEYLSISQEMMGLVRQGAKEPAALIYNGKERTPVADARKSATELMELNVREGRAAALRGDAVYASARIWIVCVLVVAALVCCIAVFVIVRGVSTPVLAMARTMQHLAQGDESVAIAGSDRRDEIGRMAAALEVFRSHAIEKRRLAEAQEAERERADVEKRAALLGMAEKIETETATALDQIGTRTAAMAATAEEMHASSARTGGTARHAASAAQQVLTNAQTVANSTDQLSESIHEIAAQVGHSTAVVARAVEAATETRQTMEALNEQVGRIGAVADMISEIAARTNLLALNATIEAARAGDAGKGFAVVASEVKALATQTTSSTQEIARHINEVRAATEASAAAVGRIEQTIGEVNAIAGSIAAAVEEQGAATSEIARNVAETASAANEMTRQIGEVSSEAERADRQAGAVQDDTGGLNAAVMELKQSLIRVVRTSTAEVDRRTSGRHSADLPCRLTIAGRMHDARIADISEGGARVHGAPAIERGTRGTLSLDGVGFPLPFIAQDDASGGLRLTFDLDTATAAKFRGLPARLVSRRAA
ncbi:MAG: methyl-accepting chemotaxis protein [Acetobacteraceae bacterium]